jgi:hypothetical protein
VSDFAQAYCRSIPLSFPAGVKRKRGERISGHAPFGWDFRPGGRLVENAREQRIIAPDSVTPANLAAVRKLFDQRGLLAADEFDNRLHKAQGYNGQCL